MQFAAPPSLFIHFNERWRHTGPPSSGGDAASAASSPPRRFTAPIPTTPSVKQQSQESRSS